MATPYQRRLYNENKELFMLIARLGNKIALQNQIRALCLNLRLYPNTKEFNEVVAELAEAKLFTRKYDLYGDKSHLLIIENPALNWIYKELKEQGVNISKARVETTPNHRIDKSLFKIQYAINFLRNRTDIDTVDKLLYELEKDSSILYTERRGLEYFNSFLKNYSVLNITKYESQSMMNELISENERQKKSVPSRKGKGKEYSEQKSKAKDVLINFPEGETPSADVVNYLSCDKKDDNTDSSNKGVKSNNEKTDKKVTKYENNFNSFLERGCLLKLSSLKITKESQYSKVMDATFTLYILDINKNLNTIKIAEKTSKAYLMLYYLLSSYGYKEKDISKCKNCPKNINSPNYKHVSRSSRIPGKGETDLAKFYYMCEPGNVNNRDYMSCEDNVFNVRRNVHMKVEVITWSDDRAKTISTDCNYVDNSNYLNTDKKYTEFQKECKKESLDEDMISRIEFSVNNYNLEYLYLGGKSRENIKIANEKSTAKKIIKNKLKTEEIKLDENSVNVVKLDDETIDKMADAMVEKLFNKKRKR